MGTPTYDRQNTRRINLKLNNKTDADIIRKLESQENIQGYIKGLIMADMKKEGKPMTIRCNLDEYEVRYGTRPIVGETYAIAERENIQTGKVTGYLFKAFDTNEPEGFAGNSDPSVKMFHGWRGTTNDTSVNAMGVFTVLEITEQKNGISRIRLSGDLHPELP